MLLCLINKLAQHTTMKDHFSVILHACKLARDLEANLPNITNQPHLLLSSCEEVRRAFDEAVHVLRPQTPVSGEGSVSRMDIGLGEGSTHGGGGGYLQAMDPHGSLGLDQGDPFFFHGPLGNEMGPSELPRLGLDVGGSSAIGVVEFSSADAGTVVGGGGGSGGGGGGERGPAVAAEDPYGRRPAGSSVQRTSRKRKESSEEYTTRVPAPRTGNTEIPPDDGYTWRKYGQKDILGSKFPRSYYRCTHKNFYGCEAKKQVQRLDDDPYIYEVTYRRNHTCQTSPTPLILPSLPTDDVQRDESPIPDAAQPPLSMSPPQLGRWLPMETEVGRREIHGGESSGANVGSSSQARGGREGDCPVADLADVMFNSASSGSSIDAIFSIKQDDWKDKDA